MKTESRVLVIRWQPEAGGWRQGCGDVELRVQSSSKTERIIYCICWMWIIFLYTIVNIPKNILNIWKKILFTQLLRAMEKQGLCLRLSCRGSSLLILIKTTCRGGGGFCSLEDLIVTTSNPPPSPSPWCHSVGKHSSLNCTCTGRWSTPLESHRILCYHLEAIIYEH